MLDIKFIRENADRVQKDAIDKGYKNVNIQDVLSLDSQRKSLSQEIDDLRTKRNQLSASMKNSGGRPSDEVIAEGKRIKDELSILETNFRQIDEKYTQELNLSRMCSSQTCQLERKAKMMLSVNGELNLLNKKFGVSKIGAQDHLDFAVKKDWLDFERGAKVAGAKFYLKGDLALLENAIYQFALNKLLAKNLKFMTVPHIWLMVHVGYLGTGFAPRSSTQLARFFAPRPHILEHPLNLLG